MISMKMDEEEKKEYGCATLSCDSPEYPYGLKICLDTDALEKLGLSSMPAVGSTLMIKAMVTVVGSSIREMKEETEKSLDLQITDMELGKPEEQKKKVSLYNEV